MRSIDPRIRLLAAFVGFVICTFTSFAQTPPAQKATVEQLTRQADQWDKAIVRKDREAIAANMTDDFRQIDAGAGIEDKAGFLAGVLDVKLRIDPYTVEDFEVRVYGDVALLSGRTRMTGAYDGKPFASHYRYIDIYVRSSKDGAWRVASVQITRVPPPAKP